MPLAGAAGRKNRFIGDAHAVVAMIFRPRAAAGGGAAPPPPGSLSPVDMPPHVPPPASQIPKELCTPHDSPPYTTSSEQDDDAVGGWTPPPVPLKDCELFFILRATNPKDRWSGQVAFPGGRKKSPQETDRACCTRETMEEVGMDISRFQVLGRAHDRVLFQRNKKLVVSCLVFFAPAASMENTAFTLEASEVAACGWCPVEYFAQPKRDICQPMRFPVKTDNALVQHLLHVFGVRNLVFTRYKLPIASSSSQASAQQEQQAAAAVDFHLWGLTLGLVSEILNDHGVCRAPLNQLHSSVLPFFKNDRIFDSNVHNMLYGAWKHVMPPMDFMRGIQTYIVALGVALGGSTAAVVATALSKL